jgi:hypothetical protein
MKFTSNSVKLLIKPRRTTIDCIGKQLQVALVWVVTVRKNDAIGRTFRCGVTVCFKTKNPTELRETEYISHCVGQALPLRLNNPGNLAEPVVIFSGKVASGLRRGM